MHLGIDERVHEDMRVGPEEARGKDLMLLRFLLDTEHRHKRGDTAPKDPQHTTHDGGDDGRSEVGMCYSMQGLSKPQDQDKEWLDIQYHATYHESCDIKEGEEGYSD